MPQTIHRPATLKNRRVQPSRVDPRPFTLEQELEPFGTWVGDPIWAPPLDSSKTMAETMLRQSRPFTSSEKRWASVVKKHRDEFTQVREIDLCKASIRLPKGRFFVSVTEPKHFDRIEETIPACVQTRLDEFLAGPGAKWGVRVYYLKPLCVEVGDDLILTTREDMFAEIERIRAEVFAEYRRRAPLRRAKNAIVSAANAGLAVPRSMWKQVTERKQRAIDAYQARLEFKRRKTALGAARLHRKCRTDGCSFDEMLALTNPLERDRVIEQYSLEKELSNAKRNQLLRLAAGSAPWFVTLSFGASHASAMSMSLTLAPPLIMCDPAFVAELPDARGTLLKIGHFDEVGGVTHIEI